MTEEKRLTCCESCGGPIVRKRALDGARYNIAVHIDEIFKPQWMDEIGFYVADRLRRAERIIEDLRAQLKAKK